MSYIDILIVSIVLLFAYSGWRKGFMLNTLELVSWLATLVLAFLLYPLVSGFFEKLMPSFGMWIYLFAVLLILHGIFRYLINLLLRVVPQNYHSSLANKIAGIFSGLITGCLAALIFITFLLTLPLSGSDGPRNGVLVNKLSPAISWLTEKAAGMFGEDMIWPNLLTVNPGDTKLIELGFTVENGKVREDLELKMLQLVNEERRKAGIDTLKEDTVMRAVAREYSVQMFAGGFFSHYTPDGKSPSDRLEEANVSFLAAGENLAIAPTLAIAHQGLMNSPGHKANILRPGFGRLGIGVIDGGRHGLMITQEFRN